MFGKLYPPGILVSRDYPPSVPGSREGLRLFTGNWSEISTSLAVIFANSLNSFSKIDGMASGF
jgi:hypothetical protein